MGENGVGSRNVIGHVEDAGKLLPVIVLETHLEMPHDPKLSFR